MEADTEKEAKKNLASEENGEKVSQEISLNCESTGKRKLMA